VSGSKGPEQLAVEVAEALPAAGLELSFLWPLTAGISLSFPRFTRETLETSFRETRTRFSENFTIYLAHYFTNYLAHQGDERSLLGALHLADYQRLPRCLHDPLRQYNARIDLEDSFYLG
jgi:hypothetical protein